MKAIETRYKGYRFRSRLEARWAVFFDAIGWAWEYEAEGYADSQFAYLPDFVVTMPVYGCKERRPLFVEIKPAGATEAEIETATERATHLAQSAGRAVLIILGLPGAERLIVVSVDGVPHHITGLIPPIEYAGGIVGPAIKAARGARFEHGETPNP